MIRLILSVLGAVALACASGCAPSTSSGDGDALLVRVPADAATLAEAADLVAPGGTIEIAPGRYAEQLLIETPDVTVRGESRNDTIIDGGGVRPFGVVAIADGVRVENLTVVGATFYGVLFTGLHDENGPSAPTVSGYERWDPEDFPPLERFAVSHVTASNNGLYGIYAFNARHGVIRDSYASGSADSGIYVGQCTQCDILVTGNVAERNAVGFENSNASDSVLVAGNRFAGNRIGMTFISSYQEAFTPQRGNTVVGNVVTGNNEPLSPAHADGAFATGIGISGGVANEFARNLISGNKRAGVIFTNTEDIAAANNRFTANTLAENGVDVANTSASRTAAHGNCFDTAQTAAPTALLPQLAQACSDPDAPQASQSPLQSPAAPAGMSFKKVPLPIPQLEQPQLSTSAHEKPLPNSIAMPDPASFSLPDASLLAEWSGTR